MSLASGVQLPSMVQSTNIPGASSSALGQIGSLGSTYGGLGASVLPYAQTTASNLYNNPYAPQAMVGASGAANLGAGAAGAAYGAGQNLVNTSVPYANMIAQTAFDPQQQLYNLTQNQTQQQINAQNAASGVGATPYGAGVADQALANFNINWQNQQLGRQAEGASALQSLAGTAQTGAGLMSGAPTTLSQTSSIPYATYSGIGTGQDTALSNLLGIGSSGASLSNMSVSDLLNYITGQTGVQSVANQTGQLGLNQSQLAFNQYGTLGAAGLGLLGGALFL